MKCSGEGLLVYSAKPLWETLKYQLDISQNILSCLIPTLALQPWWTMRLSMDWSPKGRFYLDFGRLEGNKVVLKVIDDDIGFGEGKVSSMGTGLVNIRKRLHFYYGDEFSLDIKSQPRDRGHHGLAFRPRC